MENLDLYVFTCASVLGYIFVERRQLHQERSYARTVMTEIAGRLIAKVSLTNGCSINDRLFETDLGIRTYVF